MFCPTTPESTVSRASSSMSSGNDACHVQHRGFGLFEDAVETPQHHEGQDDLAVLGLLEVAAQEFGDGPDEGAEGFDSTSSISTPISVS
jgi:hypothetical protein